MILFSDNRYTDTIQVVFFGKGYGESILLHVGNGKYVLFDSFINPETGHPIASDYLKGIGLTEKSIVGIVCTHWDDDHVKGMAEIVSNISDGVELCIPLVLSSRDILRYIELNKNNPISYQSTSEFVKLLRLTSQHKMRVVYVNSNDNLFNELLVSAGKPNSSIVALSPTANAIKRFLDSLIMPQINSQIKYHGVSNNDVSIVTLITNIVDGILLGGDLDDNHQYWEEIATHYTYEKCKVYKIPHHGSENAFNQKVWDKMVDKPISIITRFNSKSLPTQSAIDKISENSSSTFVLGGLPSILKSHKLKSLKGTIADTLSNISVIDSMVGALRLSWLDNRWEIEMAGAVKKIC